MAFESTDNRSNDDHDIISIEKDEHTVEDWIVQRDAFKLMGDTAFRDKNHNEAIAFYGKALELDPAHIVLLSNRSAAYLKAGLKSKAYQDAKACVELDPTFAKGYSRLAAAEHSLGRWQAACNSYNQVLTMDPNNLIAQKGRDECHSQLELLSAAESETSAISLQEKDDIAKENNDKNVLVKENVDTGEDQTTENEEDLLLDAFFSEVEAVESKKKSVHTRSKPMATSPSQEGTPTKESMIQSLKKNLGTAKDQIDRLLAPNYKWRNLNPFHVLDLPYDESLTEDDISRRYKALSLLLHPDKCRGGEVGIDIERAKLAYDEVQRAKDLLLSNPDKARHIRDLIEQGKKVGKQVWKDNGKKESLADVQSREIHRIFAEVEWKRREVEGNERKNEQRERRQEEVELEKERQDRKFDKSWREEERVDNRIRNWRDFQKKKKQKL
jgi:tetratricopeptide (TPR) repeat protein